MGCELCSNENRENQDVTLSNTDNKPEIINTLNKDTYFSALDERLNEKYSIPLNSSFEKNSNYKNNNKTSINNNENKNIFNYTQNIVNNNIIQYSSRNNPISEYDNKIISSILKEKGDFASNEFNSIFNKEEINSLKNESNKLSENSKINNKDIKDKHQHKHKQKHTYSSKDEEENNNKINELNKDENNSNNDINYIEPKIMKEKIKSLLKEINYSNVDQIINSVPLRIHSTLEQLINFFLKKSKKLSETEKAWLIYKWIATNIEYDFSGINNKNYDVSEEATFNRGKSICEGYAKLFKKISDNLNLIVEIITGYSKGFNYEITDKFEESESHAWNAVKIKEDWYFVETTWGAGYSEDHKNFIKRFTDYYFFTPPIQFVRGHFPNDKKWQLLPKNEIINQKKFMEFVDLKSYFYDFGFDYIDPDFTFNQVKEKGNVKIFFDDNEIDGNKLKVSGKLNFIKDKNNLQEIENSTLVIRNSKYFEINYITNKKGKYKLQVFGAKKESEKLDEIFSIILITKKDSSLTLTYPKTYGLFEKSDIQIIQPITGILLDGDKMNFEFKSNNFSKLYIGISNNDNNNFIEMEKQGNIFKEEDILIYGQSVKISTKKKGTNTYDTIIEYKVQINTKNKTNTIKYPKTFGGAKNRLIEPICDKLKRGNYYNFKIKSDVIEEMAIFIGDNSHNLEKNYNIFYGRFRIDGNGNIVQIGFHKGNDQYGILYQYDIS